MKPRLIWKQLIDEIHTEEVVVITGPRQVGKTTTVEWLLDQIPSKNKLYLDLQNLANRELFENKNYDLILEQIKNRGYSTEEKLYLAIDEIQLLPALPEVVKYLYDHYEIKFFLTGSSSFYIKNKFTESMAGRKIIYEMYPLRFQEFLTFKGIDYELSESIIEKQTFNSDAYNQLSKIYEEYINYGGLPKVVLTQDEERKTTLLQEIFSSYITLDVEVISDFKSSTDIRNVIKLLANRIGSKLNVNELSKITGLSRQTVDAYISFLEQTYLIRNIDTYSKSEEVRQRKAVKSYFIDTGIANINADLSGGAKFENTICHQLSFYDKPVYYLSRSGEIDFIVNNTAIEVKETPTDTHLAKLKERSKKIGLSKIQIIGKNQSAGIDEYLWGGSIK